MRGDGRIPSAYHCHSEAYSAHWVGDCKRIWATKNPALPGFGNGRGKKERSVVVATSLPLPFRSAVLSRAQVQSLWINRCGFVVGQRWKVWQYSSSLHVLFGLL